MTTIQRVSLHDTPTPGRLTLASIERLIDALSTTNQGLVVALEGDDVFCTGLDLATLSTGEAGDAASAPLERFAALLDIITTGPRPVIAVVDGPALGGGLGLAAAADLVVATPRATFGLPEALFGLVPAIVFPALARRVGSPRARWLALSGATLPAQEAWRLGLVDELTADLDASLRGHVRRLSRMDPRAFAAVKALAGTFERTPTAYRADAAARFRELAASDEARARIARYLAGDTPWPETPEP